MKGNRGEWSEVYVFLKLLADGKLCAADADLKKIQNICYPVLEILRRAGKDADTRRYVRNGTVTVLDGSGKQLVSDIPIGCFIKYAELLLSAIKTSGGSSFSVPSVEPFLRKTGCTKLKAGSGSKSDIVVKVHDIKTGFDPEYGFSIKSRLGKASTLLNASKATNFIYDVTGIVFSQADIDNINNKNKEIKDRITAVEKAGGKFVFKDTEDEIFRLNMQVIDSCLHRIMAEILLERYRTGQSDMNKLLCHIKKKNPLGYRVSPEHPFYEYKIKAFLRDVALGMRPATPWNGHDDVTGGYIVVREDGEVLCYHIYNRNELENYLLKNTRIEQPDRGRHKFGDLYGNNGNYSIKLNLQIRFKK